MTAKVGKWHIGNVSPVAGDKPVKNKLVNVFWQLKEPYYLTSHVTNFKLT